MDDLDSSNFTISALVKALSAESRKILIKKLAEKDPRLARIYEGIFYPLFSIDSANNPDKFPQAAHSARMLIEKMVHYIEIPVQDNEPTLGEKVNQLEEKWKRYNEDLFNLRNDHDKERELLEKMIEDVDCFFKWKNSNRPQNREAFSGLAEKLDPSSGRLPNNVIALRFKQWKKLKVYFNLVAKHHEIVNSIIEFVEQLEELESLLLGMMIPKPAEAQPDIDQIISEGES